jgi:hypothetical protein
LGSNERIKIHSLDWQLLDRAKSGVQNTNLIKQIQGLKQIGCLDIGYDKHESQYEYENTLRLSSIRIFPFQTVAEVADSCHTNQMLEVGKVVIGYESFQVPTTAGLPLTLVLRSGSQAKAVKTASYTQTIEQTVKLEYSSLIRVIVGDRTIDSIVKLNPTADFMTEFMVTIPAELIVGDKTKVVVGGDHISYCYWFFQPEIPGV